MTEVVKAGTAFKNSGRDPGDAGTGPVWKLPDRKITMDSARR